MINKYGRRYSKKVGRSRQKTRRYLQFGRENEKIFLVDTCRNRGYDNFTFDRFGNRDPAIFGRIRRRAEFLASCQVGI